MKSLTNWIFTVTLMNSHLETLVITLPGRYISFRTLIP